MLPRKRLLSSNGGGKSTRTEKGALTIRAPVTGVVLRRLQESEAVVPAGAPLLEIADRADLEIATDYLTTDAVKMRPGMPVVIEHWGGGDLLKGRVRRIDPSGFTKVSALGVEEQRVWVVTDFDEPQQAWQILGDAFRVETRIVVWSSNSALQVPSNALFRRQNEWHVYVVAAGRARQRKIVISHQNDMATEVQSGLSEGDEVVAYPSDQIEDGTRVTAQLSKNE